MICFNNYVFIKKDKQTKNYAFFDYDFKENSLKRINVKFEFEKKENIKYHSCKEFVYFIKQSEQNLIYILVKSNLDVINKQLINFHKGPALLEVNEIIYIVSGKKCEFLNLCSNERGSLPDLNNNRYYGNLFYSKNDGYLYSFGGLEESPENYLNESVERTNIRSSENENWMKIKILKMDLLFGFFNAYIELESDKILLLGGYNKESCYGIEIVSLVDFHSNNIESVKKFNSQTFEFRDSTFYINDETNKAYNYDHIQSQMVCFDFKNNQFNFMTIN